MKVLTSPQSGSYAGVTASRNRNGQYLRTRAVPVQPRTTFQLQVRARLASNSARYRSLTDVQIAAWRSLGLLMLRTDSLGQQVNLTGAQANASVNQVLQAYGQATVDDAPLLTTPTACATVVLAADSAGPTMTVTTTSEPASGFIGIYASPPTTAGRNSIPDLRLIATAAVAGSPYNILAAYTARFGTLVAGQKIGVAVRSMENGFESLGTPATTIVT